MITKKEFIDKYAQSNTVVWCRTEELAIQLLEKAHEFGLTWWDGDDYKSIKKYENYKNFTCYDLDGGYYGDYDYFHKEGFRIIGFNGFDSEFRKDDLKTGHIVTLRNGWKMTVLKDCVDSIRDCLVHCEGELSWLLLSDYNDEMIIKKHPEFSIVKVESPLHPYAIMGIDNRHMEQVETIWERDVAREMTLDQVCKELGYNVKIVKG